MLYVFETGNGTVELIALPRRLREPVAAGQLLRLADVEREHPTACANFENRVKQQAASALGVAERTLAAKLRSYQEQGTEKE